MTQEHPEQPKAELVEELRDLVEEWRRMSSKSENTMHSKACGMRADDLERVLNRYE